MRTTVVGQVTPHLLRVVEIAKQAETGANVDWHLRDAVGATVEDLAAQYNAPDLLAAYLHSLETAAHGAGRSRLLYGSALKGAVAIAKSKVAERSR